MPPRRSATRLRSAAFPTIPFDLFVLSNDPVVQALAEEARPAALQLELARSIEDVQKALAFHEVVCGVIVDFDLDRREAREMLDLIRTRVANPPTLCVLRSASTASLGEARALASDAVFKNDAPQHLVEKLRQFMRRSLDAKLRWAAGLFGEARARELEPAALETFVAWSIRQMSRDDMVRRFRVSTAAMQARIGAMCSAWGMTRLVDLGQHLLTLGEGPPASELVEALEAAAAESQEELRQVPRWRTTR